MDDLTGLLYYRARWYDPSQGRFISEDPIGFRGGDTNLYAYTFNDPINLTDPSGEIAPLLVLAIGAGVMILIYPASANAPGPGYSYLPQRSDGGNGG